MKTQQYTQALFDDAVKSLVNAGFQAQRQPYGFCVTLQDEFGSSNAECQFAHAKYVSIALRCLDRHFIDGKFFSPSVPAAVALLLGAQKRIANDHSLTWHRALHFESRQRREKGVEYLLNWGTAAYITVTGPFNAGKSQFIETISEFPVEFVERCICFPPLWEEKIARSLDCGHVNVDEHTALLLFGTPGAVRVQPFILDKDDWLRKYLGTVVIIDTSRPETFREALSILNRFRTCEPIHPYVVAASHQDDANAWELGDFQIAVQKSSNEKFIPCSALDKSSVKQVVLALLYQVRKIVRSK